MNVNGGKKIDMGMEEELKVVDEVVVVGYGVEGKREVRGGIG